MNLTKHTKVLSTTLTAIAGVFLLTGQVGRAAPRQKLLHDFTDASAPNSWTAVNDNVMGGVSKGGPSFTGSSPNQLPQIIGPGALPQPPGFVALRPIGKVRAAMWIPQTVLCSVTWLVSLLEWVSRNSRACRLAVKR